MRLCALFTRAAVVPCFCIALAGLARAQEAADSTGGIAAPDSIAAAPAPAESVSTAPAPAETIPAAPAPIPAAPTVWDATDLAAGLALAAQTHRPLLAVMTSDQCADCRLLDDDVTKRYHSRLPRDVILARIVADSGSGAAEAHDRVVLDLPTTIVFSDSGQEIDRVAGYEGEDDWLLILRAVQGRDPLAGWELKPSQLDPETAYEMGWRLLVRGDARKGQDLLRYVYSEDSDNVAGYTVDALRLLARYNETIRDRGDLALNYWKVLFEHHYDPDSYAEALAALIRIYQAQGDLQDGYDYLAGRTEIGSNDPDRIAALAAYATRTGYGMLETIALIHRVLDRSPSDEAAATLIRLLINDGRTREAREQVAAWQRSGWSGPGMDSLAAVVATADRIDNEVWTAQFDTPPQLIGHVPPECPESARSVGASGKVVLRTSVGADGAVTGCEIQSSSGVSALDQAAIEAVLQWTFRPAKQGGEPVAADILVPLTFDCR